MNLANFSFLFVIVTGAFIFTSLVTTQEIGVGMTVAILVKDFNTVTFTFHRGGAGIYTFRCMTPCSNGPMGMMGSMQTQGYMLGTLTVQ